MEGGLIQQIGTPDQIYNDPANTFVAGFIGAPPMNLIEGTVTDGIFTADCISIDAIPVSGDRPVTLGVRPEDCHVQTDETHLDAEVYGVEPTGDVTYLTIMAGKKLIEVKADRDYRAELGAAEKVAFNRERLYFFDSENGQRIA